MLENRCLEGLAFDAAVVTDLAGPTAIDDGARTGQRRAMAKLVRRLSAGGLAVVNADDPDIETLGGVNLAHAELPLLSNQ